MWIYRYINAMMEEIDIGPFPDQFSALAAQQKHAAIGVITCTPIQVADDYQLYKGS